MLGGVSYSFVISSIYVRYYPSIYLTSFTCTRPSIYLSILDFNHSIILIMSHSPSPNSLIPSLQMTEYLFCFCLFCPFSRIVFGFSSHFVSCPDILCRSLFLHEIFEILRLSVLIHLLSAFYKVSSKSQSLIVSFYLVLFTWF